jgi:succinate dehydrogenase / fumarate reductase, cytochrome b subunit
MSEASSGSKRPLSPHLTIYKPIPTMVMSILHRITGVALYFGIFLIAWWVFAASADEAYFNLVNGLFGSAIGQIILFGFSWALIHHMLGGIKHLVQDTGRGMGKDFTTQMAKIQVMASVALTILLWIIAYIGS